MVLNLNGKCVIKRVYGRYHGAVFLASLVARLGTANMFVPQISEYLRHNIFSPQCRGSGGTASGGPGRKICESSSEEFWSLRGLRLSRVFWATALRTPR